MFIKVFIFKIFLIYKKFFPIQNGKNFLGNLLFKLIGEIPIKTKGFYIYIYPNNSMDISYFNHKDKSLSIVTQEINKLKEGEVFLDIGANIGYFTFLAAKQVNKSGRVYCFEPSIREYYRLLEGMLINNFNNIVPFNIALGSSLNFHELSLGSYNHTGLNTMIKDEKKSISQIVFVDKLDNILNTKINLVKIDVEGYEMEVLLGMENLLSNQLISTLLIEITDDFLKKAGSSKNEVIQYLQKFGYKPKFNSNSWQYDEVFYLER